MGYQRRVHGEYHFFEAKDDKDFDISKLFSPIHKIMDAHLSKGHNVLVHCNQGVSRSGTIAVSYLMKTLSIPSKEAWAMARKSRSAIRPNEGFIQQLKTFEAQCVKKQS